jgi:hypothetical protein
MNSVLYKVLNVTALVAVITVNTLANTLPINGQTPGQVSARFENLFTPAGFTFSIWSIIYLGLLAFVIYQAIQPSSNDSGTKSLSVHLGSPFLISCAANIAWIYAWHYEYLDISLICMALILVSLIDINGRISVLIKTNPSKGLRWFVWAPMALYLGWICVAAIANMAVYLTSINWGQWGIASATWATLMVSIGGIIGLGLLFKMRLIPAGLSIGWGVYGIYMKLDGNNGPPLVMTTCMTIIVLLAVGVVWTLSKGSNNSYATH